MFEKYNYEEDYDNEYNYEEEDDDNQNDLLDFQLKNNILVIDKKGYMCQIIILLDLFFNEPFDELFKKGFEHNTVSILYTNNEIININYLINDKKVDKLGYLNVFYINFKNKYKLDKYKYIEEMIVNILNDVYFKLGKKCIMCDNETKGNNIVCNKKLCNFIAIDYNFITNLEFLKNESFNSILNFFIHYIDNIKDLHFSLSVDISILEILNINDYKDVLPYLRKFIPILKKKYNNLNFKNVFEKKDIKLIEYLFSNNNFTIINIKLNHSLRLKGLNENDFQYLIYDDNSIKEIDFCLLKKKFKSSKYYFHGTNSYNVYSILKNGIHVLSNTKMMKNGSVYGSGIYLSQNLLTALSYCRNKITIDDKLYSTVFLCEVIDIKNNDILKKHTNNITVLKSDKYILPRFLLLINKSNDITIKKYYHELTFNYKENIVKYITNFSIYNKKVEKNEVCPLCYCGFSKKDPPYITKYCKHLMHLECLNEITINYGKCPLCQKYFDSYIGKQPFGFFNSNIINKNLPGYSVKTIEMIFDFPNGIQNHTQPNFGKKYIGTKRIAYLPNNDVGICVYKLLKKAFDKKVLFSIGTSLTTGMDDTVIFGFIHLKTSYTGVHGYPDPNYFKNVIKELKSHGIE